MLAVWQEYDRTRHECGHWDWEWDDFEEYDLDFNVCPFCQAVGRRYDQDRTNRKDMHGVAYGWFPPKEE